MRKAIRIYTLLLGLVFLSRTVSADADIKAADIGFHFLEEPINPRLISMGSVGTAMPAKGFSFYNPSLISLIEGSYLAVEYGQQNRADLRRGTFENAWNLKTWFIGVNFNSFSVTDIIPADEQGISIGPRFSWQQSHLHLSGGFIKENFAAAILFTGAQDKIAGYTAYGLGISFGATYGIIPKKLTVGLAGFNITEASDDLRTTTGMLEETKGFGRGADLPINGRAGVSWIDTIKGIAYTVACDINYREVNEMIMVPVGIEVWPVKPMAIRLGKRIGHETELINFGFGLNVSPLKFDLGFVVPRLISDVELKWLMGLTYSLKFGKKQKTEKQKPAAAQIKQQEVAPQEQKVPTPKPVKKSPTIVPAEIVEDTVQKTDSTTIPKERPDSTQTIGPRETPSPDSAEIPQEPAKTETDIDSTEIPVVEEESDSDEIVDEDEVVEEAEAGPAPDATAKETEPAVDEGHSISQDE